MHKLFNRCTGYWPNAPLSTQAQKAWTHLLAEIPEGLVLDELDTYAAAGHTRPPVAGQLAAQIRQSNCELELTRARRQRTYASQLLREGRMKRADFNHYDKIYWQPVERSAADGSISCKGGGSR